MVILQPVLQLTFFGRWWWYTHYWYRRVANKDRIFTCGSCEQIWGEGKKKVQKIPKATRSILSRFTSYYLAGITRENLWKVWNCFPVLASYCVDTPGFNHMLSIMQWKTKYLFIWSLTLLDSVPTLGMGAQCCWTYMPCSYLDDEKL